MTASSDGRRQRHSIPDRVESSQWPAPAPASWPGLAGAAAELGVPLTDEQLARFIAYQRLLLEWNARFNLTAITDPVEIERRLFLDAIRMAPAMARFTTPGTSGSLVDIGSGAGFPGVPLAIVEPERPVTLIEATGKKVSFLSHVIAELGLRHVRAIHARTEDVARLPAERARYDLATARAVASLPALIELAMPLLRVGGHAIFPKGLDLEEERTAGRRAAELLGARIVGDEIAAGSTTRLVIVAKERPTPDRYPRRAGIPAREPLGSASPAAAGHHNGDRRHVHRPLLTADAADRRIAG